jgi:hypothetical protein
MKTLEDPETEEVLKVVLKLAVNNATEGKASLGCKFSAIALLRRQPPSVAPWIVWRRMRVSDSPEGSYKRQKVVR